jgi:hypothetical protein
VEVVTRSFPRQSPAAVDITLRNGATVSMTLDVGEPALDLEAQWARLTHKFHSLVDPILGTDAAHACIDQCATLEAAMDLHTVLACASCSYRDVRLTEADHTGCDPGLSPRQAT